MRRNENKLDFCTHSFLAGRPRFLGCSSAVISASADLFDAAFEAALEVVLDVPFPLAMLERDSMRWLRAGQEGTDT